MLGSCDAVLRLGSSTFPRAYSARMVGWAHDPRGLEEWYWDLWLGRAGSDGRLRALADSSAAAQPGHRAFRERFFAAAAQAVTQPIAAVAQQ